MHFDAARPLVVAIEHGVARRRAAGAFEEQLLGGEVGFHVAVKIQMVARQVGEDGGVEVEAVDAAQCQGVGGDLHGDVRAARAFQFGEQAQQIERFRRRVDRLEHAAGQVILDGADHRGGLAGGAQHRIDQVRGGGLAVGPGDAGESEALVGPPEEIARGERERLPAVLHLNPAAREIRAARAIR